MKHTISVISLILGTVLTASAAYPTPTPTSHTSQSIASQPKNSNSSSAKADLRQIYKRLRNQEHLIGYCYKSKKITKDQAVSLNASLKVVQKQEIIYFRQNGNQDLNANQLNLLNEDLDKNSATLGEKTNP